MNMLSLLLIAAAAQPAEGGQCDVLRRARIAAMFQCRPPPVRDRRHRIAGSRAGCGGTCVGHDLRRARIEALGLTQASDLIRLAPGASVPRPGARAR
jgi:hypothetical protein